MESKVTQEAEVRRSQFRNQTGLHIVRVKVRLRELPQEKRK